MRLHLAATLALCTATAAHAEAMRVNCLDGAITSWGTCVAIDERHILTANHVVAKGAVSVELDGKWEPAKVIARDVTCDMALLRTEATVKVFHELLDMPSLTLHASRGIKGDGTTPVEKQDVGITSLDIGGDVGQANSGAPVLVNDCIVGIVIGVEPGESPKRATCVPAETIRKFLAKAGWKKKER